jgi:hypothetical protein
MRWRTTASAVASCVFTPRPDHAMIVLIGNKGRIGS